MCELKICFDREVERSNALEEYGNRIMRAWGINKGFWNGAYRKDVITYKFLDRDPRHEKEMEEVFGEIEGFTRLKYRQSDTDPLLRITFDSKLGSWSFVGNDNQHVEDTKPTMNIGWYGKGTKRHENGHQLGASHEHQHPADPIKWNKPKVYEIMAGAPNYWSEKQTDYNYFRLYNVDQTVGTRRDRGSIMHYPIDKEMTLDGYCSEWNTDWSVLDLHFFGTMIYPKEERNLDPALLEARRDAATVISKLSDKEMKRLYSSTLGSLAEMIEADIPRGRVSKTKYIDSIREALNVVS